MHRDAVQQLEAALLGSSVSSLIDLLSERLQPSLKIWLAPHVQHLQAYTTSKHMAPPPMSVPVGGLTSSSPFSVPPVVKNTDPPSKQCHIVPTLIQLSAKLSPLPDNPLSPGPSVKPFLTVVIPELAIPPEAMLEQIKQMGGVRNYQCWLGTFVHTNKDCMLTHVHKHLNITIVPYVWERFPKCCFTLKTW